MIAGLDDAQLQEIQDRVFEGWDERNAQVAVGVKALFIEAGRTGEEGVAAVGRLWDAIKNGGPEAVQAAIDEIERVTGGIVDLAALTEQKFNEMASAAQRYGIDLEDLGDSFLGAELSKTAGQILRDFDLLTQGGADVDAVLTGMGDEISNLVRDSLKFGLEIPANMRPLLEQLLETGQLIDENGNALTSLENLAFAETLAQGFDRVVTSIDGLADIMAGRLPDAFASGVEQMVSDTQFLQQNLNNVFAAIPNQIQIPIGFAGGALPQFRHGTGGEYAEFGRGTVAMLHNREAIVRPQDTSTLARDIAAAMGGGGVTNNYFVINGSDLNSLQGRLPRGVIRELDRLLKGGEFSMPSSSIGDRVI